MEILTLIKIGKQRVPLDQVVENMEEYGPKIITQCRMVDILGVLVFKSENNSDIIIDDDISGIMNNLCFKTIPELLTDGNATVKHLEFNGEIKMEVDEDLILVEGDHIETAIFFKKPFILGLYNCGLDFVQLLKKFDPPNTFIGYIINLEKTALDAKKALEEHKLIKDKGLG